MINNYKREIPFGFMVFIVILSVILFLGELALMHVWQSQEIMWQGTCTGRTLSTSSDNRINMAINCPLQDEFSINTNSVIIAYINNGHKEFICQKTKGNIMKNENWHCLSPEGED